MIDYEKLAFILIKPPAKVVSTHKIKNKKEHASLLEAAKHQSLLIYYAHVKKKGNKYFADEPLIIDEESAKNYMMSIGSLDTKSEEVEVKHQQSIEDIDSEQSLICPFCKKKMNSTPGRTLHIKHKHPDRFKEYKDML